MVRLVRHGGRLCAVIITGQTQHAAVFGGAGRVAVAKDVAATIDARSLAIPNADHAIVAGAGRKIKLLRTPDRGRCQVFVYAGLKFDVVLLKVLSRGEQLLVVAAQRRAPIS